MTPSKVAESRCDGRVWGRGEGDAVCGVVVRLVKKMVSDRDSAIENRRLRCAMYVYVVHRRLDA